MDGIAMEVKISFIIGAYERPLSLRTCLASLVDQTEAAIEVLVVDNSVDRVMVIANARECSFDERIHYMNVSERTILDVPHIRHKRCLYTALEIGAASAKGEWLCFAGQDAYFAPVFAQRMLLLAEEQPFLDFIHCDTVLGGPGHGYFTLATAPRSCAIDLQSFIMKRSWFQGFPDKHTNYELADGLFVESLVARGARTERLAQVLTVKN